RSPCLVLQTLAGLGINAILLAVAFGAIVLSSRNPAAFLAESATIAGWLAMLLNLVAAGWYIALAAPRRLGHVAGVGGLLLGVLVAATVEARWPADWLAHHVLTGAWTAAGLVLLTLAWASHRAEQLGPLFWGPQWRTATAQWLRIWLPERAARAWVTS